jgi:RND family efflux transporter MFP subunit
VEDVAVMRRPALVVAVVAAAACGDRADQPPPAAGAPPPAELMVAESVVVTLPLRLPAQLYVEHDAVVYARATGVVESVYVDIGDPVQRGVLMVRLESTEQEIALAEAEANLANAARTLRRLEELAGSNLVSQSDSEQAALEHVRATLSLRQARRDFAFTRVVAPFSGVVTQRSVRPGRLVAAGDTLLRVSALRPLLAAVQVPEPGGARVAVGDSASVVALQGGEAPAVVVRAAPTINAAAGTREVVVRVSGDVDWPPGAGVEVLLGAETRPAVAIPRAALTEQGYVLVWENARAVLRRVVLGPALDGERITVLEGLSAGERLVRP